MMTIDLREFSESDYPEVCLLWASADGVGLSEGDSQDGVAHLLKRNPRLSWVAVTGAKIVGAVLCGQDGRRGLIYHLAVAPDFRRLGLGTRLVTAALAGLRAAGIEQCYSLAFTDNSLARAFWKRFGSVERTDLALFRTPVLKQ